MTTLPPPITLLGQPLHPLTQAQTLDHIACALASGEGGWVLTPNLDILRRLTKEPATRDACAGATLRIADGMPLIWASRLQGTPLPERVPGSDLILTLSQRAAHDGRSVFLLGGDPGVETQARDELVRRFPALRIVGAESPPFGFDKDPAYVPALTQRLRDARPDIVFVALGFPKQERLIAQLRPALPAAWFLGVGISFSFVAGAVRRAPHWVQAIGLEWFHRLLQEPRRLFRRYLIDGVPFAIALLLRSALARRRAHTPS